jgi:protein-tyrosine phosphatase
MLAASTTAPPMEGTYWVVPGTLACGPYPGATTPDEAQQRIDRLAGQDLACFVNLMFDSEVDHSGHLFAEYEHLLPSRGGMKRFPIEDVHIPTADLMVEILDHIDAHLSLGVYVHCWGGVGRTGTVVGCWLIRHGLATSSNVMSIIHDIRRQDTVRGHRRSPETFTQERFVQDWQRGR